LAIHSALGNAHAFGDFEIGQPTKKLEHHDSRLLWILSQMDMD
jgi:hypothetical protein